MSPWNSLAMRKQLPRPAPLALAFFLIALAVPARAQPRTWTGVERIVAVGDIHGDHDQFVRVLRAAEVTDDKDNWIVGKTHLVQLGDVLDRGPDSRKAMDMLMKLEKQAARAGGAVHALLGNHEVMVLQDYWVYVHPGEVKAFGGVEEYRAAMSADGAYGKWIRTHNTVVKINDLLFVHAGITPPVAHMSLAEINKTIRAELAKGDDNGIATDASGPLWTRELAIGVSDKHEELDETLKNYGAKSMVIGHTVATEGVVSKAGGRLIRIDVGMSKFYEGPAACLVVEKGRFYEVRKDQDKPAQKSQFWPRDPAR
jgi:hypothetical protein